MTEKNMSKGVKIFKTMRDTDVRKSPCWPQLSFKKYLLITYNALGHSYRCWVHQLQ